MKKTLSRHSCAAADSRAVVSAPPPRHAPRILAALFGLALLGSIGLFASRPAHSVGGPVAVSVANTPLAVTAIDSPGQQPYVAYTTYKIANGGSSSFIDAVDGFTSIKVPAGKRFIIQTISCTRSGYQLSQNVKVTVQVGNGSYSMATIVPDGTLYPGTTLSATLSAEPGSYIDFTAFRSGSAGNENLNYSVNGYLVNA